MKHPDHVESWTGSLEDLAKAVANMRYETVAEFMGLLSMEFRDQASGDRERGRRILSARLDHIAQDVQVVQLGLKSAWTICEPYMKDHPK